jgi:hypothetical protein
MARGPLLGLYSWLSAFCYLLAIASPLSERACEPAVLEAGDCHRQAIPYSRFSAAFPVVQFCVAPRLGFIPVTEEVSLVRG